MLHVVSLAIDESTQVEDHTLSLVTLSEQSTVGVLESGELLLVPLALALELLGNLLLEDKGLKGIIALLLSAPQTNSDARHLILLVVQSRCESPVLLLVAVNLELQILSLLCELLSKGLELQELLLPRLELLNQEVVALGDLGKFGVHAALEVDKVLPGFDRIARVLVPLSDNLVQVASGNFGHQRLLLGAAKDSFETLVAAKLFASVVHDGHDSILVPPFGIPDALNLAAHDNYLTGGDKLATAICGAEMLRNTRWRDITVESLGKTSDHLLALTVGEGGWWAGRQDKVAVKVNDQGIVGSSEEGSALGSDTEDVRTRFLDKFGDVAGVDDGDVETTPLVDSDSEPNSLSGRSKHRRVVADEDDAASGRNCGLNDANNVGDGQAGKERPESEVLETSRRGWELVA